MTDSLDCEITALLTHMHKYTYSVVSW